MRVRWLLHSLCVILLTVWSAVYLHTLLIGEVRLSLEMKRSALIAIVSDQRCLCAVFYVTKATQSDPWFMKPDLDSELSMFRDNPNLYLMYLSRSTQTGNNWFVKFPPNDPLIVAAGFPPWLLILILSPPLGWLSWLRYRNWQRLRHNLCLRCSYDLRGCTSAICPECGTPFTQDTARP